MIVPLTFKSMSKFPQSPVKPKLITQHQKQHAFNEIEHINLLISLSGNSTPNRRETLTAYSGSGNTGAANTTPPTAVFNVAPPPPPPVPADPILGAPVIS
jgi:hypothetical protein